MYLKEAYQTTERPAACRPKSAYPRVVVGVSGQRYYSPELGRWVSRDPIEEQGGLNLYGLLANAPPIGLDLLGLAWVRTEVPVALKRPDWYYPPIGAPVQYLKTIYSATVVYEKWNPAFDGDRCGIRWVGVEDEKWRERGLNVSLPVGVSLPVSIGQTMKYFAVTRWYIKGVVVGDEFYIKIGWGISLYRKATIALALTVNIPYTGLAVEISGTISSNTQFIDSQYGEDKTLMCKCRKPESAE